MPEIIEAPLTVMPISSGDHATINDNGGIQIRTVKGHWGETQLDKFAGLAMQSIIQNDSFLRPMRIDEGRIDARKIAEKAYDMAEYMIDEKLKREAK